MASELTEDAIPDLRLLLVGLGELCAKKWPELVKPEDTQRIRDAADTTLVAARILCGVARRAGITAEEIASVVQAAAVRDSAIGKTYAMDASDVLASDVPACYELLWNVDACLADPSRRTAVPSWFVDSYYPQLLRRLALGGKPNSRDLSVMAAVLEKVSGRRG